MFPGRNGGVVSVYEPGLGKDGYGPWFLESLFQSRRSDTDDAWPGGTRSRTYMLTSPDCVLKPTFQITGALVGMITL